MPCHFRLWRLGEAPLLAPGAPVNAALSPGNGTRLYQFAGEFGDQARLQLSLTNLPSGALARLVDPFNEGQLLNPWNPTSKTTGAKRSGSLPIQPARPVGSHPPRGSSRRKINGRRHE